MDLIVCGEVLWISCGTWLGLLNGAIGALVGAVVAMVAIVKTIGTQRQLFAIERSETYTANLIAERKRKADLDRQLATQREDVQLQLDAAAKEASRQRELAAIADLAAAAESLMRRYDEGIPVIQDIMLRCTAASDRWRMETDHAGLQKEIAAWPQYLGDLALSLHLGDFRNPEGTGPSDEFTRLGKAVIELRTLAMRWTRIPQTARDAGVRALRDQRIRTPGQTAWPTAES